MKPPVNTNDNNNTWLAFINSRLLGRQKTGWYYKGRLTLIEILNAYNYAGNVTIIRA